MLFAPGKNPPIIDASTPAIVTLLSKQPEEPKNIDIFGEE